MALNPAFQSQGTRKLPLAFGYIFGQGDNDLSTTAFDGSMYKRYILGEGEWDGIEMANNYAVAGNQKGDVPAAGAHMWSRPLLNGDRVDPIYNAANGLNFANYVHFHSGAYTPIGTAIPTPDPTTGIIPPNSSNSEGPDQGYDRWLANFPTVMPPQALSGIAYSIWGAPNVQTAYQRWLAWPPPQGTQSFDSFQNSIYQLPTISGMAVYRALRCRIFDAFGNVVAYQFTCNPAWHKVEAILRRKIRPEQPALAGLTDDEKACFNWESIVELAARNDTLVGVGRPAYVGNYIFAADTTLAQMMETMCRVDRSYQRIDDRKIVLTGDGPRASVFLASARHLIPGTLALSKKDVSKEPNVFVPTYRDLDIPAVCKVLTGRSVANNGNVIGYRELIATTPCPFTYNSYVRYGGCSDPTWDGSYYVLDPGVGAFHYPARSASPNSTYVWFNIPQGTPSENVTDGYLGSDDARFSQRAPVGVQHRSAQKILAKQAPGLAVGPSVRKVFYDCGNSTFDQTNRLMKFERDRQLGTDTGTGWKAPIAGTLSLYPESVDANGAQLLDVVKQHEVITLDDWLFPEGPGDYEVIDIGVTTVDNSRPGDLGRVDLRLQAYNRNAYPQSSDDPGDYFKAVPNSSLKLSGFTPVANAAWVLNSTLGISDNGDGTVNVVIPDLAMQVMGKLAATAYPGFSVASVPKATPVALYVTDPAGDGVSATYGWVLGTDLSGLPATTATLRNLLQNGDFSQSGIGFYGSGPHPSAPAYWTVLPTAGGLDFDEVIVSIVNGGEAVYTRTFAPLTAAITVISQIVDATRWTPGEYLMLSGCFLDTALSTPNTGVVDLVLSFMDSSGALISSATVTTPLDSSSLVRIHTPTTLIPAGTAQVVVSVGLGGTLSFPAGSRLTMTQIMLEQSTATQTSPSVWAAAAAPSGNMLVYTGTFE